MYPSLSFVEIRRVLVGIVEHNNHERKKIILITPLEWTSNMTNQEVCIPHTEHSLSQLAPLKPLAQIQLQVPRSRMPSF